MGCAHFVISKIISNPFIYKYLWDFWLVVWRGVIWHNNCCLKGEVKTMLIDKLLFSDKTPLVLKKGLDFQSARNLMLSTNISNMETPDFKAHDINFEKQLQDVIKSSNQLQVRSTNSKHFGSSNEALKGLDPLPFELKDPSKSNGNNVNIDKEMGKLAENQIMYTAFIQLMMKRGSTVRSAVTELPQQ